MLLAMAMASSGCTEKMSPTPASNNSANEFKGQQITVCSGAGLIKPMNELDWKF